MSDDEPHRKEDNAPLGEQTKATMVFRRFKLKTVIVEISFDDHTKELSLWDYLYDTKAGKFEMDASSDYDNRIQYYEITSDYISIRSFKLWLLKNDIKFKHKFDK